MTPTDDDTGPEGDDLIAAEYVLGVLPADERLGVARRMETDRRFARLVEAWEVPLSPLADAYVETPPPDGLKTAIDRRLFSTSAAGPVRPLPARPSLWSSLAFWRALAAAAIVALLVSVAAPYFGSPRMHPEVRLVASLAADGSDVKYLAVYDAAADEVGLSHVGGKRAAGRDFQLWVIEGKNAPISMGVIPSGSTVRIEVTPDLRQKLAQGAVLAISLEPAGGSPTGQPTGPVVATGDLKNI